MIIKLEKTAITKGVAKGVKNYHTLIPNKGQVLDYGAGKLRNSKFLLDKGYEVYILDTPTQLENISAEDRSLFLGIYSTYEIPNKKFDAIFCTFVLNVIPDMEIRDTLLNNIHSLLKNEGFAVIEVRTLNDLKGTKSKIEYKDGFLVGTGTCKTFQKGYEYKELRTYLESKNFKVLEDKQYSNSLIFVIGRK